MPRVFVQMLQRVDERFLFFVIEIAQHLDVQPTRPGVGSPSLAALTGDAALVEIVDGAREMFEPFAAARFEALHLGLGNLRIPFEQVGRHLERRAGHVDEARPVLREALAQQCPRFGGADARGSLYRVGEGGPGGRRILGSGRHARAF